MRTLGLVGLAMGLATGCEQADPPRLGAPCECPGDAYPCALEGCGDGAACRGGTCTIACSGDADCPAGAICSPANQACIYDCRIAADCPLNLDACSPQGECYGGPLVVR